MHGNAFAASRIRSPWFVGLSPRRRGSGGNGEGPVLEGGIVEDDPEGVPDSLSPPNSPSTPAVGVRNADVTGHTR